MKNNKPIVSSLAALAVILLVSTTAGAAGFGFYFSSGYGDTDFDMDYDYGQKYSYDSDLYTRGFGFVLDTNVLGNRLFNYRLNMGFERIEYDDQDIDIDRFVVDNTFGFAMVRTPLMRMWVGPQVRMSYTFGDDDYTDFNDIFGLGVGIDIGTNFRIGRGAVLSMDTGYRISGHWGDFEDNYDRRRETGDFTSTEGEAFFRISFFFQTHERRGRRY